VGKQNTGSFCSFIEEGAGGCRNWKLAAAARDLAHHGPHATAVAYTIQSDEQ
jgi:hypothetical protein